MCRADLLHVVINVRLSLQLLDGGSWRLVGVIAIICSNSLRGLALALRGGSLRAILGFGGSTLARSLQSRGRLGRGNGGRSSTVASLLLAKLLKMLSSQGC